MTSIIAFDPANSFESTREEDPLIEIPSLTGTELIKKSQISGLDIRSMVVRCTICRGQINHLDFSRVKKHRLLNVIICRDCYGFYGTEEFTRDDAGKYNYCTWCGNGGKLFVCDFCPNVFCSNCVRLNFGRAEVAIMQKDGWKCYVCDPSKLKTKVEYCDMILEFSKSRYQKIKKAEQEKELISENWLLDAFNKTENACKSLIKKMDKLKHIEVSRSKSLKHTIKKMEEVVSLHKTELGHVLKTLSNQYEVYLKDKQAEEKLQPIINIETDSDRDTCDSKPESKTSIKDVKAIKNKTVEKSSFTNGIKSESIADKINGIKAKDESKDDNNSNFLTEIDQEAIAKESLLRDSSEDSEMDLNGEKSRGDDKKNLLSPENCNITVTAEVHSSENDVKREKPPFKPSKVSDSKLIKISPSKNCAIKESSMSSLSSESAISLSDEDQPSRAQTGKMSKKKNLSKSSKEKPVEYDYVNDEKLRTPTIVRLERCDELLNGETTIKVPAIYLLEDLDKEMTSLMKEPVKKKSSKKDNNVDKKPKIRKAVPKRFRKDSSSSITFSSDEKNDEDNEEKPDEKEKKPATIDDAENLAKEELLKSGSSSYEDSSSDSVVEVKKNSKKSKVKSDSSDDFVPRKKKKHDKLLNKRIFSDDSENENNKRSSEKSKKKRRLASDDDLKSDKCKTTESVTTSDSDDEKKPKTKKRRRIKKVTDSSTNDDADEKEKKETPKKGRKDIKKIISKKDLQQETKEAQQAEKERRKIVEENQKLYNIITEASTDGTDEITKKMVLEVDPVSKEELVQIHPDIIEKLKSHQVKGVKFMWGCTIESLESLKKKPGSGCILAHCMGLGKTFQVITFLHTCLTNPEVNKTIKRAMVICPLNVVLNWSKEIDMWLSKIDDTEILVHEIASAKDNYMRLDILKYWHKEGGILIISYDIFRRLAGNKIPKLRKTLKIELQKYLLDPGPDIVVCDEGHILKNETSAISKACALLRTKRRIVLTGTPLQNNLKEYHCMLSFVKPHLLGTNKEFRNRFVNPIMNGQYEDSNEYDVRRMKKRVHILQELLKGCVQRCDYSALTKFLPPKHEFVISVKLSGIQIKMYAWYLENLSKAKGEDKIRGGTLFQDYNMLRNICTHPYLARISCERAEKRKLDKEEFDDEDEYEDSFIDDSSSEKSKSGSGSDTDEIVKTHTTRSRRRNAAEDDDVVEEEQPEETKKEWYDEFLSDEDAHKINLSGKIVLLMNILKECEAIGDKVIVFSQSLLTLNLIEEILSHADESEDFNSSWTHGVDYFRMDGSTSADFRKQFIDMFNSPVNYRARLFLVSTRAGGLGTNLVGANRVVILDASWNPSHDVQAIFRVYRFGQKKPVYIYRLLAQGTMEEKIYDRQVTKLSLAIRVVDEQQIDRHFNSTELSELYTFEPESLTNRPTPMVPQDRLLAEMLIKYNDLIVNYHEHDSLLQNETETDLTEEERKAAWNEFENEREGRYVDDVALDQEIAKFCKEPDFSEADYSGQVLSDTKLIIEDIIKSLRIQFNNATPALLRKKLLIAIQLMKTAFQEKHVKLMRVKQEWLTKGSVPASVNKFLDELNKVINELTSHHYRVGQLVAADNQLQANVQSSNPPPPQAQPQMQQNYARAFNVRPGVNIPGVNIPGYQSRFPFFIQQTGNFPPRYPPNVPFFRTGAPAAHQSRTTHLRAGFNPFDRPARTPSSTTSQPVITEAPPDDSGNTPHNSNTKSSVVIEEIE